MQLVIIETTLSSVWLVLPSVALRFYFELKGHLWY